MNHRFTSLSVLVALLLLGSVSVGRAQQILDPATGNCNTAPASTCVEDGDLCGVAGKCLVVGNPSEPDSLICLEAEALACCGPSDNCPVSTDPSYACLGVTRPAGGGSEPVNVCVDVRGGSFCGATTLVQLIQCHTAMLESGVRARVSWAAGDCDDDGTPNARDPHPCMAARPRGVYDDSGDGECLPVNRGCVRTEDCNVTRNGPNGSCTDSGDGHGLECVPLESPTSELYCTIDDGADCLPDETLITFVGVGGFCVPPVCEGIAGIELRDCITDDDGDPVPPDRGDCDGDGEANRDELDDSRDPCVDERVDAGPPPLDAGLPPLDAGAQPLDAGPPPFDASADGGAAMGDAGASTPVPSFNGGGGCTCRVGRASGPSSRTTELSLGLLGVCFAARWRRRKAAPSRDQRPQK